MAHKILNIARKDFVWRGFNVQTGAAYGKITLNGIQYNCVSFGHRHKFGTVEKVAVYISEIVFDAWRSEYENCNGGLSEFQKIWIRTDSQNAWIKKLLDKGINVVFKQYESDSSPQNRCAFVAPASTKDPIYNMGQRQRFTPKCQKSVGKIAYEKTQTYKNHKAAEVLK